MTESQKYVLIERCDGFEIRDYEPCVLADVVVEGDRSSAANIGFRPLISYISSSNIAMTAPVIQEPINEHENTSTWRVSFVMPANSKVEDIPTPLSPKVELRAMALERVAAIRFSGFTSDAKVKNVEKKLLADLARAGVEICGPTRVARFNPPWIPPFARHNELIIPIKKE